MDLLPMFLVPRLMRICWQGHGESPIWSMGAHASPSHWKPLGHSGASPTSPKHLMELSRNPPLLRQVPSHALPQLAPRCPRSPC
eukprot:2983359-Pyramimonas_sp.AAC.1